MLTIFSAPKAFQGLIGLIQRNAILSWTQLSPAVEVILLGEESGLAEFAREHGLRHLPHIERNEYGTPLVSSIFRAAAEAARFDRLAYVNADIILMHDFLAAVEHVAYPRYLMVGQRWDLAIERPVDYSDPRWEPELRREVRARATRNIPWAIDYFVHTRGMWEPMPPFAIGRFYWDNWLIYDAVRRGLPIVDATPAVTAVHQNHDYARTRGFVVHDRGSPESRRNAILCGRGEDYSVYDAHAKLRSTGQGERQPDLRLVSNNMRYWSRAKRWMRRAVGKAGRIPSPATVPLPLAGATCQEAA